MDLLHFSVDHQIGHGLLSTLHRLPDPLRVRMWGAADLKTPLSSAAFATAGATLRRTRESRGLGIMYSGPNRIGARHSHARSIGETEIRLGYTGFERDHLDFSRLGLPVIANGLPFIQHHACSPCVFWRCCSSHNMVTRSISDRTL